MKKILTPAIFIFCYMHSFAYSILQTTINNDVPMGNDAPPEPPIAPFGGGVGEPETPDEGTPIDFIVPLLLISAIILMVYFVYRNKKKNKLRSI